VRTAAAHAATVRHIVMLPSVLPWPATRDELVAEQRRLAATSPEPIRPGSALRAVAGCFICFQRGTYGLGSAGDPGWAAAALMIDGRLAHTALASGTAGAPYEPGLLALRAGPLLEAAVRALRDGPDVLLVDATGRDHPRGAGLALHLGARLGLPTIGITDRTLVAGGAWPTDTPGATSPLRLDGEIVGFWVRTRARARPLAVHAAWRTDAETAVAIVLSVTRDTRTPEPLRQARRVARGARAAASPSPTTEAPETPAR
jgi:deoxyribonuclease V